MSWNDTMNQVLARARELHKTALEAASRTAEEMRPHVEEGLKNAQALQATLSKHAAESGQIAADQTKTLLSHVGEYVRLGQDAMRQSADMTRATVMQMSEHARKIADAAAAAAEKSKE